MSAHLLQFDCFNPKNCMGAVGIIIEGQRNHAPRNGRLDDREDEHHEAEVDVVVEIRQVPDMKTQQGSEQALVSLWVIPGDYVCMRQAMNAVLNQWSWHTLRACAAEAVAGCCYVRDSRQAVRNGELQCDRS